MKPHTEYNKRTSQDWQREIVDWADSQGFETWTADHRSVLRNMCSWFETQLGTIPTSNSNEVRSAIEAGITIAKAYKELVLTFDQFTLASETQNGIDDMTEALASLPVESNQ